MNETNEEIEVKCKAKCYQETNVKM